MTRMSVAGRETAVTGVVRNALARYHPEIRAAAQLAVAEREADLAIPLAPPEIVPEFTDVTDVGLTEIDRDTFLLDLMRNPGARTTKTMASLLMVSRAVGHIRRTGEKVLIFTPTSGNKGTALRDAVARAYRTGLATPEQLRMVMLVPGNSRAKLRDCALTADAALLAANPVAVADVAQPADVKGLAADVLAEHEELVLDKTGFRIWYTLDLDNYRIADSVRALVEAELLPFTPDSRPRLHAHAVSSAFGLLGYSLGRRLLTEGLTRYPTAAGHPGFFLIQQLATADMVTSLLGKDVPGYGYDRASGCWRQDTAPEFPAATDDPVETIDPTFYTKAPVTRTAVNTIVARHGGGGIVVSKRECLERFGETRALAANAGIDIAADPALIREWSLVKALTGVLLARERGLVRPGTEVVVHASGYYSDELVPPVADRHLSPVRTAADLADVVFGAASA
jgi:hypothetical protein